MRAVIATEDRKATTSKGFCIPRYYAEVLFLLLNGVLLVGFDGDINFRAFL